MEHNHKSLDIDKKNSTNEKDRKEGYLPCQKYFTTKHSILKHLSYLKT